MAYNKYPKTDHLQDLTDKIVAELEKGEIPWRKGWKVKIAQGAPRNFQSNREYNGLNFITTLLNSHPDPRYGTFKQISEAGGQVKKGSKATPILAYNIKEEDKKDKEGNTIIGKDGEPLKDSKIFIKWLSLFNVDQASGLNLPDLSNQFESPDWSVNKEIDKIKAIIEVDESGSNRAFYHPLTDALTMPHRGAFENEAEYNTTFLHEVTHWAMDSRRTPILHKQGGLSEVTSARSELRAELGSFFLVSAFGLTQTAIPEENTLAYIQGWVKALKNDPKEILQAARDAQKIADFVIKKAQITFPEQEQTNIVDQVPEEPQKLEKIYINVPFKEKGEAKDLGAKWDKNEKSWYYEDITQKNYFEKWEKENNELPSMPHDPIEEFKVFLVQNGAIDISNIQLEKKARIAVDGDKGEQCSGDYQLFMNKGNGVPSGFFNNYRTGVYEKWTGRIIQGSKPIPITEIKKRKAEQQRAKDALQHTKFHEFKKEFDSLEKASPLHPYAVDKGLRTSFFLRNDVRQDDKRNLVFPIKDKQGKITNLQRVWAAGNKQLEKDGVLAGSFVKIVGIKETEFVLVTEGISTGATVNDITGIETYASLTGNNLSNVVVAVKELHPDKTIVIAGDNDFHLELRDPPLKNSGLINAEKAAEEVGGTAIFPPFNITELSAGQTDWNDYNKEKGFSKTRDALRVAFKKIIDSSREVEPAKKYEVEL